VLARLEGDHQSEFLDGLDLFATIRFCEVLGAVALFGQRIQFNRLHDELWLAAAAHGFEIAKSGQPTNAAFLDELLGAVGPGTRKAGLGGEVFGTLYRWLAASSSDPAYHPPAPSSIKYARKHLLLGAEANIFGVPATSDRFTSLAAMV
jgi:hypothetical protein